MLKIGVNTPLLKESIAEIGIYDTLKWVAEIGYHYIEVSQVPINPETVKEFRRAEDDFGIQVCSISADAEPEPQTPDGARKMNVRDDLEAIAEAGEGNLDIPGIISAGDDVGAEYIFLEQDLHYGRSEREILMTDYENLCRMGYKDRM